MVSEELERVSVLELEVLSRDLLRLRPLWQA